jgi:hypothetical protein
MGGDAGGDFKLDGLRFGLAGHGEWCKDQHRLARVIGHLARPFKLLERLAKPALLEQCGAPVADGPAHNSLLPFEKRSRNRPRLKARRLSHAHFGFDKLVVVVRFQFGCRVRNWLMPERCPIAASTMARARFRGTALPICLVIWVPVPVNL